ncbi:hypothetical protein K0U00_31780, partial [Paenibacillus sepulcri]|nr:hypothetical protein [Paenibacillus sepulcri]
MSLQWGKAASIGRKMLYAVLCAFMFTTAALPSIAAEPSAGEGRLIHVAKNGSDSNSGTEAEPYLTINHAAQEAQP